MREALEDLNVVEEVVVLFSLLLHSVLNDVREGVTIEGPELARCRLADNGGSARSVIEQGKLTEGLAGHISLQESILQIFLLEALSAIKLALLDEIEVITVVALLNNDVSLVEFLGHDGVDNLFLFVRVERLKDEVFGHPLLDCLDGCFTLRIDGCLVILLLVELAENLGTDTHARTLLRYSGSNGQVGDFIFFVFTRATGMAVISLLTSSDLGLQLWNCLSEELKLGTIGLRRG